MKSQNPIWPTPKEVRRRSTDRGLRAWRAPKRMHGTQEALNSPAVLTTSARRVKLDNQKKWGLNGNRESDRPIVTRRNPAQVGPKRAKGPT